MHPAAYCGGCGSYQSSLLSKTAIPGAPVINQVGAEGATTGSTAVRRVTFNLGYSTGP